PGAVVLPVDVQRGGGIDHRGLRHILRLIHSDRGQDGEHLRRLLHQFPGALVSGCGNLQERVAQSLHMRPEPLQVVGVRGEDVHLVGDHDLGPLRQVRAVLLQLRVDGVKVLHRVPALAAGHVNHMDQQAAAVHVPQEVVAQAGALAGALNDAGNVRHDEADAVLYPHHAQIG
ncbi:Queuosine ECF transporter S component QueT, partial [Dysosmobacter welbionis]